MSNVHTDLESLKRYRRLLVAWARRTEARADAVEARCRRVEARLDDAEAQTRRAVDRLTGQLYDCHAAAAYGYAVNCGPLQRELSHMEHRLAQVLDARRRFDASYDHYAAAQRRVDTQLTNEVSAALAYLDRRIASLEAYLATALFAGALAMIGSGVIGVMGAAIGIIRKSSGDLSRVLGRSGEEIAAIVLSKRFGLEEVAFDQPAHGFDRVFRAPGLPVVVMESKVSGDGKLHLGETEHGRQGGADWVAAAADAMADPESAQHSPTNARIAAAVRGVGADNVPVVAVVTNPMQQTADVYRRTGGETWELVEGGIDLAGMADELDLAEEGDLADELDGADEPEISEATQQSSRFYRPESREGSLGGAERKG